MKNVKIECNGILQDNNQKIRSFVKALGNVHSLSINHPHQPGSNAFMGLDDEQANIIEELKLENNDLGQQ